MRPAFALATAFTALVFAASGEAAAKDRIALPYTCTVDGGRLRLEPSGEHDYPIVGPRDQRTFTFCPMGGGGRCHTWMVHRFAVQCTGGRAAWPEIVAAAARHQQSRAVIEGGQLLLRLGPRPLDHATGRCGDGRSAGIGRAAAALSPCPVPAAVTSGRASHSHILAMPRGFAPVGLIGGRFIIDAEPHTRPLQTARAATTESAGVIPPIALPALPRRLPETVISEALSPPMMSPQSDANAVSAAPPAPTAPPRPIEIAAAPRAAAPAEPSTPVIEPLPLADPVPPTFEPIAFTQHSEVAGIASSRDEQGALSLDAFARTYALILVATALTALTALTMRRRRWRRARWHRPGTAHGGEGDGQRAVALRDKAEGHITLISTALDRLAMMAPLRNALSRDLQSSERRLAVVVAAISTRNGVDEEAWTRARRRLERIATDLDRLQHIAESAVSSLSGLGSVRALPRNKDEAYLTLGVTPGVSEAILKRLVEALRISWHPDLAQNEADREARDVRIKEINVAWDLITGKRDSE